MDDGMKTGQGLRALCEARQVELQAALTHLGTDGSNQTRKDIEGALDALGEMLTGDLDHIPSMVTEQLSKWLERSKHLGLKEQREIADLSGKMTPQ